MIYHVTVGDRTWVVELGPDGTRVDGRAVDVDFEHVEGSPVRSLMLDGTSHRLVARRVAAERWDLHVRGRRMQAEVVDERTRVIREMTGAGSGPAGPVGSTDSPIAGRTLSCAAGGPPSSLTFGADGSLSGRLLDRSVTGQWFVTQNREIHTHVIAGPVSIRDNLRRVGNRWVGRSTTCTG